MKQAGTLQRISHSNLRTRTARIFSRTLATTTEDDNLQDGKGVADKTKFTFSIVYTDPSGADSTSSPQATSPQVRAE